MAAETLQLSVIIVNYNVKFFLEQCINAVLKAMQHLQGEIIAVDNDSVDGSVNMLKEKFHQVRVIENKKNVGFARANNQAIRIASGRYILLLNPDTVVEEDTFEKCLAFMENHPEAGATGVKMIDGKGRFLPESKRALPTPSVAFYKIIGLSLLFPRSKIFGQYHLGYLDRNAIHEVEVLSGAFMFIRKAALDKAGLLDEDYFMYGEDIDLSYKITLAGYKNYYFPHTTIIHYKGESTKKGSLNYVFAFYNAMIIFVQKNFSARHAKMMSAMIRMAIYLRAFLSIIRRTFSVFALPLMEALLIFSVYLLILPHWEHLILGGNAVYPPFFLYLIVPSYILIWLVSVYFAGGYDKPSRPGNILRGIIAGTIVILLIYALLPITLRFSRALILMGSVISAIITVGMRYILALLSPSSRLLDLQHPKKLLIAGSEEECKRVHALVSGTGINHEVAGYVSNDDTGKKENFIGSADHLKEIVRVNGIDEIIFCSRDISSRDIIQHMLALSEMRVNFKIAPRESISIIGSNSVNAPGELYVLDFSLIALPSNKRNKRLLDFVLALLLLILSPILVFFFRNPLAFLSNINGVLNGRYSWVGYINLGESHETELPPIRKGILNSSSGLVFPLNREQIARSNLLYARDYKISNDVQIILRCFRELDRKPE